MAYVMAAAPLQALEERTVRIVCASLWKGRECGATIAIGEDHLPCDICRGLERRMLSDGPAARWAAPISFSVASVPGEPWEGDAAEPVPAFDDEWTAEAREAFHWGTALTEAR